MKVQSVLSKANFELTRGMNLQAWHLHAGCPVLVVKTEVWLFPPRWDCCAAPAKNNFSHNGTATATARRDGGGEFYVDGVAMQFCQRKWQQFENLSSIKSKNKPVKRVTEEAFLGKWQNYARARILSTFQAFLASSNGGRERVKGPISLCSGLLQGDTEEFAKPPVDSDLGCSVILPGQ